MDEGDKKSSVAGRVGHVEWLLDALQSDFEAMHSTINKVKAEQSGHTEMLNDMRAQAASAFNSGGGGTGQQSAPSSPTTKSTSESPEKDSGGEAKALAPIASAL